VANPSKEIEVAGVLIPGPIVLGYLLALTAPEVPPSHYQFAAPKLPIKRDQWKLQIRRTQLPAVCAGCMTVLGRVEGGRLEARCWRCEDTSNPTIWWDRLSAVNALVGPDWGLDAVAATLLEHIIQIRKEAGHGPDI